MKRLVPYLATAIFGFSLMTTAAPVLARGGDGSSGSDRLTEQQETVAEHAIELSRQSRSSQNEANEAIENRARELVDSAESEDHSQEARQKACEKRKTGIETKVKRLQTNAARFNNRITAFLTKAQNYITDNSLVSADIESSLLAATDAQVKAGAAVTALQELSPNINCTDHNVAAEVAKIKAAAEQTRSALKAYKEAVKSVYSAIEAADSKEVEND